MGLADDLMPQTLNKNPRLHRVAGDFFRLATLPPDAGTSKNKRRQKAASAIASKINAGGNFGAV